jgi:hypothetical protein
MNPRRPTVLFLCFSFASCALVPLSAQPSIREEIDALLKLRLQPRPLPVDPPNPFRDVRQVQRDSSVDRLATKLAIASETDAIVSATAVELDATSTSNAAVLASCVSRLRVGGIMRLKEEVHVVINDVPRREGDIIGAVWRDTAVAIRVVRIQAGQLTLRFGDAETVLKF